MLRKLLGRPSTRKQDEQTDSPPREQEPEKAPAQPEIPGLPFAIRPMTGTDISALAAIYTNAVDGLASEHYTARQRKAWKKLATTPDFSEALRDGVTVVAENEGDLIAFAQLHPNDCIRMLYVASEWSGLGISTLLYQYLEDEARIAGATRLRTEASLRAKRFFEQMGFSAGEEQQVKRNGVSLTQVPMEKILVR